MTISADRNGVTIQVPRVADPTAYQFTARLVNTAGSYSSSTNWVYYELPPSAIIDRSRSTKLDAGTWQLQMTLLKEALPDAIKVILTSGGIEYYTLEVDILGLDGTMYPYHTGPIDSVQQGFAQEGGAIVETLDIASFGILQRSKKMYSPRIVFENTTTDYAADNTVSMLAEARNVTGPAAVIGTRVAIPGSFNTMNAQRGTNPATHANPIQVTTDSTWATITRTYGVDYVIESSTGGVPATNEPLYIRWITAVPATYYVKYWQFQYAAVLKNGSLGTGPAAIRVPDGRNAANTPPKRRITDDFLTRVASAASSSVITPEDTYAYISTNYLVAVTGFSPDFLEWQKSDGTTEVRQISSTSGAGVITLTSGFTATPAVGDYIRVVTCDAIRAFDKFSQDSSNKVAALYVFNLDTITDYPRASFKPVPELGAITLNEIRHFDTTTGNLLYNTNQMNLLEDTQNTGLTSIGSDNRLESVFYQLLVQDYPIMQSTKFTVGTKLGTYAKNIQKRNKPLDTVISELVKDGMPPNGFLHDRPDGGIVVGAFSQSTAASISLSGIASISTTERPEPITSVSVISRQEEPYLATHLFRMVYTSADWTNPQYMFDGQAQDNTRYAGGLATTAVYLKFPISIGPYINDFIDEVRIYGTQGVVTPYVFTNKATPNPEATIPGFQGFTQITTQGPLVIPGEAIADAIAEIYGVDGDDNLDWQNYETWLGLVFAQDDMPAVGLPARITEIQVYSKIIDSWTAHLTDDTTTTAPTTRTTQPTNWTTVSESTGAGPNYWQRVNGVPMSFKYIPSSLAQRIQPLYDTDWEDVKYRNETINLTRISQIECRQTAERYLDEYLKLRVGYNVRAVLHPCLEPGDTVSITLPDGTVKNLFIWGISDSGGPEDFEADYELVDYSA